jgi:hypothetical protein
MTTPEQTPATTARAAHEIRKLLTRSMVNGALIAAILVVVGIFWPPVRLVSIAVSVAAIVNATYCVLYLRRALVEFGGGRYRVREATTDVSFSAADVALAIPVDDLAMPGQTGPALVIIGTDRRRLAEINAAGFGTPALEAFVSDLLAHGAEIDHLPGRVTPLEFARRHPDVLSWQARHPVAVQVLIWVSLLVLTVISALLA